jgi:uncharacterized protein (DUF1697 family)
MRCVALLRGVNVGGKNVMRMAALKACFEADGFRDVATFIQSGNVLFEASGSSAALTKRIEKILSGTFGYEASVVLVSALQLRRIVEAAPAGFGSRPDRYRYDVLFLKPPLKSSTAIRDVPLKDGVDTAAAGPGVIYCSRLISRATQSRIGRIVGTPVYRSLTIRNWNTTTKLLRMLGEPAR